MNDLIFCPNQKSPERWLYRGVMATGLVAAGTFLALNPASWGAVLCCLTGTAAAAAFAAQLRRHSADQLILREDGIEVQTGSVEKRFLSWTQLPNAVYAHSAKNWSYLILSDVLPDEKQIRKLVQKQGLFGSYVYESALVLPLQSFSRSNPGVRELMEFVTAHATLQKEPQPLRLYG